MDSFGQNVAKEEYCYDNLAYFQPEDAAHTGAPAKCLAVNKPPSSKKKRTQNFWSLFRFGGRRDVLYTVLGLLLTLLSGTLLPVCNLAYAEIINMMLDRQHPGNKSSTPLILLSLFNGGQILTNASREERMDALMDDVYAHNWVSFGFNLLALVVAAAGVTLVKLSASCQAYRIRKKLFASVMRHDMTWFDVKGGQNFAANMNEEVSCIENGVGSNFAILAFYLMNVVFGMAISFYLSWKLTLVVGALIPLNLLLGLLISQVKGITPLGAPVFNGPQKFVCQNNVAAKEIEFSGEAGNIFTEAVSNIRTVLAFGGENKEVAKYDAMLQQSSRFAIRRGFFMSIASSLTWVFNYLTFIVTFLYGVRLFEDNETVYAIELVFATVWVVTMRFGASHRLLEKLTTAVGSAASVFHTIDAPHGIDPMTNSGAILSSMTGQLDFRNVHFRYPARPEVPVLTGLNLSVKPGETVALVGTSGSGKTTILQLIQRFYDTESGSFDVEGINVKMLNVRWWREQIGIVGQEAALFAGTVRENIRFGQLNATDEEVEIAAKKANAHNFIRGLSQGYNTMIGTKGTTLSGGEKQRIAIARALVRNPKILLLDEPTSALDAHSRDIVQAALEDASRDRTTLLVTHRLASTKTADRIVVISGGHVVEEGTHAELLARNGIYSQMSLCEDKLEQKGKMTTSSAQVTNGLAVPDKETDTPHELAKGEEESIAITKVPWKVLLFWNRPELVLLVVGFLASAISGALLPISAVIYGEFVGAFSLRDFEAVRNQVDFFAYFETTVLVVMFVTVFTTLYVFTMARERLTNRLRIKGFSCILKQELGWFDNLRNHVGALYSRFSHDVTVIHDVTGPGVACIIQAFFNLSVGCALSLFYSWKLTLVTEAFIPFLFLGPIFDGLMTKKEDLHVNSHLESASRVAAEALGNKQVVASLGLERYFISRYNEALESSSDESLKASLSRGLGFAMGQALPGMAFGVCFWYGCYLIREEDVPFQDIVKVSEILLVGAWMVASELVFTSTFSSALHATSRLQALYSRTSAIKDGVETTMRPLQTSDKIQYSDVTMAYPTQPDQVILHGLSLDIKDGQRLAVVGPSGSGKSSVLGLLQRLYDPSSGRIALDGTDIKNLTLPTLRHHLGLVSQEPTLFSGTIRENIAYGDNTRDVPMEEIIDAAKAANIHKFIVELPAGYDTQLGKKAQLSGGQKQRVAIARALVRDPKVLLLDEATSALDPESERVVQEALNKAAHGRTTITIAHRLGAVANADTVIRLQGGRIVEEGNQTRL